MTHVFTYDEWKRLYEQSMGGMSSPQTFADASTSSVKAAVDKLTSITFPEFMEGLREFLSGTTGIIVQAALDMFGGPFGAGLNITAWSSLLAYDIYRGINEGSWDWFNIILDAVGVATTGLGVAGLKKIAPKIAKASRGTLDGFLKELVKADPILYNAIKTPLVTIGKFLTFISTKLGELITRIASKLKNSKIHTGLLKIQGLLATSIPGILTKIEAAFGKKAAHYAEHVAQHHAQHAATHTGAEVIAGGHGAQVAKNIKGMTQVKPTISGKQLAQAYAWKNSGKKIT